jgi:hypothetical protein
LLLILLADSLRALIMDVLVQGVWLALLTTSGSLARVVGPLFVTELYESYGTYVTFGLVTGRQCSTYCIGPVAKSQKKSDAISMLKH